MHWNWQQKDWPDFRWDSAWVASAEETFLIGSGVLLGSVKHLGADERSQLTIEAISSEAVTTSEIEGEMLDRLSIQSSIRKQLGLATDPRRIPPGEQGIAEMIVDLYRNFDAPLTEGIVFAWHSLVMSGRQDLDDIGRYRSGEKRMQVVSGRLDKPAVHFEAPPSSRVPSAMGRFVDWFNETAAKSKTALPALTRAGIAHLYFESIHPFEDGNVEDGNGRIGRAIAEKALAQGLGQPTLVALSATLLAHRRAYYDALEAANKSSEINGWLLWFAGIALEAQQRTLAHTEFVIKKARFFERFRDAFNERQQKALLRMFRAGPDGFRGGLSAGNYIAITGASQSTATRDLADLANKGALNKIGEIKRTRYFLS